MIKKILCVKKKGRRYASIDMNHGFEDYTEKIKDLLQQPETEISTGITQELIQKIWLGHGYEKRIGREKLLTVTRNNSF